MKKINIFLPPVINHNKNGEEFVDTDYFIMELEYPYDIDWYADDKDFIQYLLAHKNDILNTTPSWYQEPIYSASMRDLKNDKTRQFYFIMH